MYTNYSNISLPLAVWLAADDGYDMVFDPKKISATTLLKPIRSVVLERRLIAKAVEGISDIADLVPARVGQAVHTAAEVSWLYHRDVAFRNLQIPQKVIDRIRINPDNENEPDIIPIYIELRSERAFGDFIVSGKFDFVSEARVRDIKTTKTYNWIHGGNDEKYAIQGSIYRVLNPEIIRDDHMEVMFLFTDWSPLKALADKEYPQQRCKSRILPLMPIAKTEAYIMERLDAIKAAETLSESELPRCTPEELWQSPAKWAFYKDSTKTTRATKLYDNPGDAIARNAAQGNTGLVVERIAEPKFCYYCPARAACTQAAEFENQGLLK